MGKVNDLLFDNDQDDWVAEDPVVAGGETLSQGESEAACEISDAQQARLYLQAMAVLDMLKEESFQDLLILEHSEAASNTLETDPSAGKAMAQRAMENASLVRLDSFLLLIAQKVAERSARKVSPTTLLSWTPISAAGWLLQTRWQRCARARVDPERGRSRGCGRRAKRTAISLTWSLAFLTSSCNIVCPFVDLHTTRDAKAGVVGVCSPARYDRYMICLGVDHI